MNHTFLFQEAIWKATGKYSDPNNNIIQVEGETKITHLGDKWLLKGSMKLILDNPIEFQNNYEIVPFKDCKDFTNWKSYNPALGNLSGKFMVVSDSLISSWISEDKNYSGVETLIKIGDKLYHSRGFAFKGDEKLSSWSVELRMISR